MVLLDRKKKLKKVVNNCLLELIMNKKKNSAKTDGN